VAVSDSDRLVCVELDVSGSWSRAASVHYPSRLIGILALQPVPLMVFSSVTCLKLFLQGMKEQSKVYIAILNTLWFFTCLLA